MKFANPGNGRPEVHRPDRAVDDEGQPVGLLGDIEQRARVDGVREPSQQLLVAAVEVDPPQAGGARLAVRGKGCWSFEQLHQ